MLAESQVRKKGDRFVAEFFVAEFSKIQTNKNTLTNLTEF